MVENVPISQSVLVPSDIIISQADEKIPIS